jgi:hypothetical protein
VANANIPARSRRIIIMRTTSSFRCEAIGRKSLPEGSVVWASEAEHRLDRCLLKGAQGDVLKAIGAAAAYKLRC